MDTIATPQTPIFQTIAEFAAEMKISKNTAVDWIKRGDIPVIRIRRTLRINREAALKALEERS
jgi:excisionase family DNA binding protein